jgi:predicted Zn-dependent protease
VIGNLSRSLGAVSDAEAALRNAVAAAPREWRYAMMLGDTLGQEKRYREALSYAEEAEHLAPDEGVPYLTLGKLQLEQAASPAAVDAARRTLLRSAALQPAIPMTYLLIERSYAAQGRWREAQTAAEGPARVSANGPAPLLRISSYLRRLGENAAADHAFRHYRELQRAAQQRHQCLIARTVSWGKHGG